MTNNLILADARAELFVTLFYTILEPDSGQITYVNAGHPPPLLVRAASGEVELFLSPGSGEVDFFPSRESGEVPGTPLCSYNLRARAMLSSSPGLKGRSFRSTKA